MKNINFCYIINLNTPNEEINERFNNANYKEPFNYYIYPAVNGWDIDFKCDYKFSNADWWKIDSDNLFWNREVTPGETGCTLSHYNIIKAAYDEGFENVLILEEDINPSGKFPTQDILDEVPADCSILYLDSSSNVKKEL